MVLEHGDEYSSEWAVLSSISSKLGMTRETLRRWVRRAQVDGGRRTGVTTAGRERIRQRERENRELRRASEILRAASFLGAALLEGRVLGILKAPAPREELPRAEPRQMPEE